MPKNKNLDNKEAVDNLTQALDISLAKQEEEVGQKEANKNAAETNEIVDEQNKKGKKLDPTIKKTAKPIPVEITDDESDPVPVEILSDKSEVDNPKLSLDPKNENDYVDELGRKADKSSGGVDDVESAKNKLALMKAEDKHNKKWAPQLKMKAKAEELVANPAGFIKTMLLKKLMLAVSEKARAEEKVEKDEERLAASNAADARLNEATRLHEIISNTSIKEKEILKTTEEIVVSKKEIVSSKEESIETSLDNINDPLTELNSSGEEQVDLLKTQTTLLEKLVSKAKDDSKISASEELVNEARDKKDKGEERGNIFISDKKDKDKESFSLSDMFGKKGSFGKMFGKKGSLGKMFGGKMGFAGGKMGGGMLGKAGGMLGKAGGMMGGLGTMASGTMASMGGLASGAMGALSGGGIAAAATAAAPFIAGAAALSAIGAGGYMLWDSMRGSDESKAALDAAEEAGAVEHNIFGDSTVLDWDKVKAMSPEAIQDLSDYDDWDSETKKGFDDIINGESNRGQDYQEGAAQEKKASEDIKNLKAANANVDYGDEWSDDIKFENPEVQKDYDRLLKLEQVGRMQKNKAIDAQAQGMMVKSTGMHTDDELEEKYADKGIRGDHEIREFKKLRNKMFLENEGVSEDKMGQNWKNENLIDDIAEDSLKKMTKKGEPNIPDNKPLGFAGIGSFFTGTTEDGEDKSTLAEKAYDYTPMGMMSNMLGLTTSETDKEKQQKPKTTDGHFGSSIEEVERKKRIPKAKKGEPNIPEMYPSIASGVLSGIGSFFTGTTEDGEDKSTFAEKAYDKSILSGITNTLGLTTSEDDKVTGKKSDIFNRLSGTTEDAKDESTLAEKVFDYTPMGIMSNMLGWTTSEADKEESIETSLDNINDPLTELNSSGEEQVDILKTQTTLLKKLVSKGNTKTYVPSSKSSVIASQTSTPEDMTSYSGESGKWNQVGNEWIFLSDRTEETEAKDDSKISATEDESTLAEKAYDYTPMGMMSNMLGWTTSESDKEKDIVNIDNPVVDNITIDDKKKQKKGFDYTKRHKEWTVGLTKQFESQGFTGPAAEYKIKKRADRFTKRDQMKFHKERYQKEQDSEKSRGIDRMNQTALANKTAGVAQNAENNQNIANIDNSVVNNTTITENKSHDADPTAQFLNKRLGSQMSAEFT